MDHVLAFRASDGGENREPRFEAQHEEFEEDQKRRCRLLEFKFAMGLDFWTGKPLEGETYREWLAATYAEEDESAEHKAYAA